MAVLTDGRWQLALIAICHPPEMTGRVSEGNVSDSDHPSRPQSPLNEIAEEAQSILIGISQAAL